MSLILDDFKKFTISNIDNFPVEDCNIKDDFEDNVFFSENRYLCLIINKKNKEFIGFKLLNPYIASFNLGDFYAWTNDFENGDFYVDNYYNPVHPESEDFVIGFIKQEKNDFELDFDTIFDIFENKET